MCLILLYRSMEIMVFDFAITGIPNMFFLFSRLFLSMKNCNLKIELSSSNASPKAIVVLFTPIIAMFLVFF